MVPLGGTSGTTLFLGQITRFLNLYLPSLCRAPYGLGPLLVVKEFELQARQNLCTLNFWLPLPRSSCIKTVNIVSRLLLNRSNSDSRVQRKKMIIPILCLSFVISRRALGREGDYEMMPVCACVCALVCTAADFL